MMTNLNEIILLVILIILIVKIFLVLREIKSLKKMIESYINKDYINKGGKNGGSW